MKNWLSPFPIVSYASLVTDAWETSFVDTSHAIPVWVTSFTLLKTGWFLRMSTCQTRSRYVCFWGKGREDWILLRRARWHGKGRRKNFLRPFPCHTARLNRIPSSLPLPRHLDWVQVEHLHMITGSLAQSEPTSLNINPLSICIEK